VGKIGSGGSGGGGGQQNPNNGPGAKSSTVVAVWEGMDCGTGLGTEGQYQPVLNLGGGPQVEEREPAEDGGRDSPAKMFVARRWG